MNLVTWSRFLLVLGLFWDAVCMFSKRQGPNRDIEDHEQRFKANIDDLFLSNDISARRAQSIYSDGAKAGHNRWRKFARVGNEGTNRNIHRDLLRKFVKGKSWPELYMAPIRVWCVKENKLKTVLLPMYLPHELIYAIGQRSELNALLSWDGCCQATKDHMAQATEELGLGPLICVGLWGDATPCNFDRSQSVETFSMNFPGLTGSQANIRMCMTGINKKFMAKHITCDDIMAVLLWSFRCLAMGVMPSVNHLGQPLTGTKRKGLAGKPVPRAVLAEVRCDWAWLKEAFRFPQHNELAGICFLCSAKPGDVRDCSSDAGWRTQRLSHFDLARRMLEQGLSLSPIMSCPGFKSTCFLLDWLHIVDIGVATDFLAGLLLLICQKLPGPSRQARIDLLWEMIQQFYKDTGATSRLDMLKHSMLQQPKRYPKLRARAAEARGLIPFGLLMARAWLGDTELEATAKGAMEELNSCFEMLSPAAFNADTLAFHSKRFCLLYVALEEAEPQMFHIMPKLHMFQELTQMSKSCPSLFWTYRDEEFGGTVASLSRRRGGSNNPTATAFSLLNKFRAKNAVPRIL